MPENETHPTPFLIEEEGLVKPRVQLVGIDSNAFSILFRIKKAWWDMGRQDIAEEWWQRGTGSDYSFLLHMAMEYIDEEHEEEEEESWPTHFSTWAVTRTLPAR